MSRKKQQSLFDLKPKRGRKPLKPHGTFGGMYLKNYNANCKRPMDSKKALHVVVRSEKATGEKSFKNKNNEARIWQIVSEQALKCGVRIYAYANGGNHLHIVLRVKNRSDYSAFIRSITGLIARHIGKSERGKPFKRESGGKLKTKFWDGRPFTRIVSFGKTEFHSTKSYLLRNTLEAIGWMPYISRDKKLPSEIRRWYLPIKS
jgi:REP element-mobilizing transposase RayT